MRPRATIAAVIGNDRATSTVEFALIAPALIMSLMGLFEFSHHIYTETMLEGAIQKAARDSTIEGFAGRELAINTNVTRAVHRIVPSSVVTFSRRAYTNFNDIDRPEEFTDTVATPDGICNDGEPFIDQNGNGTWDADRGRLGNGSADDAVLYEVTVNYQSFFPIGEFVGLSSNKVLKARTVLRNQPFTNQSVIVAPGNCP